MAEKLDYAQVMAVLTAEQQEAIAERLHTVNEEAKGLRSKSKDLDTAIAKIKARFGVESITDDFLDSLQKKAQDNQTKDEKLTLQQRQLDELKSTLSGMTRSQREASRDSSIVDALGRAGVRSDAMANARKLVAFDSEYVEAENAWMYNGKPLDAYISEWAKMNKYLIGNPVKNGNGNSNEANQAHNQTDKDFISEADYMALSPEVQRTKEIADRAMKSMPKW